MKKSCALLAIALSLSAVPALAATEKGSFRKSLKEDRRNFVQQQRQENRAIRKEAKDLPPAERLAAIQQQRRMQFDESGAFIQAQHDKKMQELDTRLAANAKLSEAQKASVREQAERQYQENLSFRRQQFEGTQNYVSQVASDPSLTPDQRRSALETYHKQQRQAVQDHFKTQRAENKELRGTIKKR